jgi:hypothetical protein
MPNKTFSSFLPSTVKEKGEKLILFTRSKKGTENLRKGIQPFLPRSTFSLSSVFVCLFV